MRINEHDGGCGPIDAITAAEQARKEELAFLFGEVRGVMEDPADFPTYQLVYSRDEKEKVQKVHAESIIKHKDYLKKLHYKVIVEKDKVTVDFNPSRYSGYSIDEDLVEQMVNEQGENLLSTVKEHKDRYELGLEQAKIDVDETKEKLKKENQIP